MTLKEKKLHLLQEEQEEQDELIGYVSVNFADQYIAQHFRSSDSFRASWEALEIEDKKVLLLNSFESIERVPYTGRKTCKNQEKAFPRCPDREVPIQVQNAQVENAIMYADDSSIEDMQLYDTLRQYGITYYRIGNLSERFRSTGSGNFSLVAYGIISPTAVRLLRPYTIGGYCIE